jgi:hypothetical protein
MASNSQKSLNFAPANNLNMKHLLVVFALVLVGFVTSAQQLYPAIDTISSEDKDGNVIGELKWGYKNMAGEWVVYPVFDQAGKFSEGMAIVGLLQDRKTWKYGFVDETGKLVVPLMYDEVGVFSEGLAFAAILNIVWEDKPASSEYNKIGYIDKSNKMVIQLPEELSKPSEKCFYKGLPFASGLAKMYGSQPAQCPNLQPIGVYKDGKLVMMQE